MSMDPEKRDLDPAVDKVWAVDVSYSIDYTMYLVAKDEAEAKECANAHLYEENEGRLEDPYLSFRVVTQEVADVDWVTSEPYGRCTYRGKYLRLNAIIDLINNPPPPPPAPQYDTLTELMPFVDSPPPLRAEGET